MDRSVATLELASKIRLPAIPTDAEPDAMHACKILIIDDEAANVRLLERVLSRAGFQNFVSTTDSRESAALFLDFRPDLVLTDWLMPDVDGCAVIGQLRALLAADEYLPIVVLTADITPQTKKRALIAGATDFLTKPFDQIEVLLRIQNLLQGRLSHLIIQRQNATLEQSVHERTLELERALSEIQRTQRKVIQQERLAALGTMAAGIAHDFNNALSVVMGFSELLLRDAELGVIRDDPARPIHAILTAASDAAKIVQRLTEFYRPDELSEQRLPVDLNALIEEAILMTRPRWQTKTTAGGKTITIATDLGEVPTIAGVAAELREMLTNLIFNAVDAMPQGGVITVATRLDGDSVALAISDTGTGMTEEVRQRCLEPFFSTKGKLGTGLGLSMVFGIIQRHGGSIEIESAAGQGTTFRLALPVAAADHPAGPEAVHWSGGSLRILVVDDQAVLCQLVCENLQDDHHFVETALSGREALEKFRVSNFDLVITDHVMAGMTGVDLAIAIKQLDPHVPVILLSGYSDDSQGGKQLPDSINLVLSKPASRTALRQALEKVMAKTRRPGHGTDPGVVKPLPFGPTPADFGWLDEVRPLFPENPVVGSPP